MLKIWGRNTSSNVQKVIWALAEMKLPFERIDVGGAFGKTKDPFYLAMNPNSLVPTLEEEDGFTMWESNSIVRYLAAQASEQHARARRSENPRPRPDVDGLAALGDGPVDHAGVLGADPHAAGKARPESDRGRQGEDHRSPRRSWTPSSARRSSWPATNSPTATSRSAS